MAKKVIHYELFTNQDKLKKIHRKEQRQKSVKYVVLAILILFLFFIINVARNSRCDYYKYLEETKAEETSGVSYELFGSGFVKYSSNGIEYQKKYGSAEWNYAISFSRPFVVKTNKYLLLGDRGGNKAILFNGAGKVHEYTMKYPIVQMDVAQNGNIEAILEGNTCNYVQIYTMKGNLIAETRATLSETGYPLSAALSPDGTLLAISYYNIDNLNGKSKIVFYDFKQQIQVDTIPLKGTFEYEDCLIPRLQFLDNEHLVAHGDGSSYYFDISDTPKESKKVDFAETVESIFSGDNYFGYVCDNEDPEEKGRYHLLLYSKTGRKRMETVLNMNYQDIYMIGNEIIATKDNECTIISDSGSILFQGTLAGSRIEKVLPCEGWHTYRVVFSNKIAKMKISFFAE